ncbi:MAG: M23 family metallopeptidase [bacterium]|nr:M23 family metallopeptidase [bacterium]
MAKERCSLPFKKVASARTCTAPFHRTGRNMKHCVDFYLPSNTPIRAACDGIVMETESRYNKNYRNRRFEERCNRVVIMHDSGEETVYAHLAWRSVRVRKYQEVKRGQIIALSGQTGYASYPHLHFGVYNLLGKNIKACFDEKIPRKVSYKRYS